MTDLIERIKADSAAGAPDGFHWIGETLMALDFGEVVELFNVDWSGLDEFKSENKRRIARVPEMEQALIDQAAEIERLRAALTYKPTEQQKQSAALSYDHSFGLMNADDQSDLTWQAGEWLIAWQHEARVALQEGKTDG